ncbi:MAG TPA: tripartite tricarboxylate transporter permease, partial [Spirochaetales bacterium]|nr:tripartite tricarboxylate transporter permease [Spirochaetales bacterium]
NLLPALVGLFAVSELIKTSQENIDFSQKPTITHYKIRGFGFSWAEFRDQIGNFIRSSLIGTGIGILPGIGGNTSNILSYIAAKKLSKHPEKFGTGIIDGIVASETANNASIGGALVPLLTLGIPGDSVTAMLIGAFMIHGLTPGPLLFENNSDLVYSIFAILIVANFIMIIVEFFGMRFFVRMLNIPKYILLPVIVVLCVVGAFGLNNRIFDAWIVLIFGALGYLLNTFQFPLTPTILGFILTPLAEIYLRRGLQMAEGNFFLFFTKPISAIFLILSLLSILFAIKKEIKNSISN